MSVLKIATLFSGVGTPEQSLKHLNINHKTIFACEIDKYARVTYLANNQEPNTFYEDVTKLDANKYLNQVDGIIAGFPCQAFSIAGKQLGFEDTRGTLFFDTARVIKESQPKFFVLENVQGLTSHDKPKKGIEIDGIFYKKGYPSIFNKNYDGHKKGIGKTLYVIESVLKELEYKSVTWDIINTKDYTIPQNRDRIYFVAFKEPVPFWFAPKQELKLRLKDMLEDNVDSKYLLNQELVEKYLKTGTASAHQGSQAGKVVEVEKQNTFHTINAGSHGYSMGYVKLEQTHQLNIKGNDSIKRIYSAEGLCPSLTTMQGGHREPKVAIANGLIEIENDEVRAKQEYSIDKSIKPSVAKNIEREMESILISDKDFYVCKADAGWQDNKVGLKISPTIRANNSSIYGLDRVNYIFRKLTPRECFRLQGFDDNFIFPPKISDSQLYKQAGNGMSRNVLDMIFTQIFTCYAKYTEEKE